MAHDVFICHAHKDRRVADAICEKLETAQVRCWIAERDISAGEDRTEATRHAIGSSRVMVVVLSENANAAPHIEREIAHAFYTKRTIIPLRLTDTLPRRDFLFYLGNVRGFDAFSPSADQHLEALTESINGIVHGRPAVRNAGPSSEIKTTTTLNFPNSWIGGITGFALSNPGTLETSSNRRNPWCDCMAIVACKPGQQNTGPHPQRIVCAGRTPGLVFHQIHWPGFRKAHQCRHRRTPITRFGLWVAPSAAPTPPIQGPQQSANATSPPRSEVDRRATGEAESLRFRDGASAASGKGAPTQKSKRRERHRGKSRPKRRTGKTSAFEDIRSGLRSLWHQIATAGKEPGNR